MRLRTAAIALLVATALVATGCSDDKKSSPSSGPVPAAQSFKPLTIPTDLSTKPAIPKTDGLPPEKLVVKDVVPGTGRATKAGDTLQVKYVGVSYSTDAEFDSNWGASKKLLDAKLAPGGVIKGWVQGLAGMKEGGRRLLVIPPDLGYGAQGQPPTIAPYETLVFVIDLKKIK